MRLLEREVLVEQRRQVAHDRDRGHRRRGQRGERLVAFRGSGSIRWCCAESWSKTGPTSGFWGAQPREHLIVLDLVVAVERRTEALPLVAERRDARRVAVDDPPQPDGWKCARSRRNAWWDRSSAVAMEAVPSSFRSWTAFAMAVMGSLAFSRRRRTSQAGFDTPTKKNSPARS